MALSEEESMAAIEAAVASAGVSSPARKASRREVASLSQGPSMMSTYPAGLSGARGRSIGSTAWRRS